MQIQNPKPAHPFMPVGPIIELQISSSPPNWSRTPKRIQYLVANPMESNIYTLTNPLSHLN
jgi:hypothetical protein